MVENHPKNLKQAFSAYNLAVGRVDPTPLLTSSLLAE